MIVKPPTTREVITCLEGQLNMWQMGWNRDQHIIACLKRAIKLVRKSARKGKAKK